MQQNRKETTKQASLQQQTQNNKKKFKNGQSEKMKQALSEVYPALSTSLSTNSSAALSHTSVAFLQVLAIGAFDDGPSFLRLFVALPSFKLSCSLASWYVTSIAISPLLMIFKMCCTTASSSTIQITQPQLLSLFWYFPTSSMLANVMRATESWTSSPGRHGRLRISNLPRRSVVARSEVPQIIF